MGIKITFDFSTADVAKNFLVGLGKKSKEAIEAAPVVSTAGEVIDLSGGPAEQAIASQASVLPSTAGPTETIGSPVGSMLGAGAPVATAPAVAAPAVIAAPLLPPAPAPALPPAPAPVPLAPVPVVPVAPPPAAVPEGITQANVIAAFTQLGQTKGGAAIAALLAELGVATVVELQSDTYVDVLNRVSALLIA